MKNHIKKTVMVVISVVVILTATFWGASDVWAGTKQAEITVVYDQIEARQMLSMINNFRLNDPWVWNENNTQKVVYTGLSALEYDNDLEKIAMQRAAELAISFSHTRPNGERCFTAYDEISNNQYLSKGENIAYGYNCFFSSDEVFDAWAEEDEYYSGQGHRRNMISSNYTAVGIGYARYDGKEFWCQEFGSPKSNAVDSGANTYATKVQIEVPDTLTVVDKGVTPNDTDNNIIDNNLNNTNTNNNAANDNSNKIFDYTDTFSDLRTGKKLIFNTRDGKPAVYVFGGVGSCGLTDYSIESLSTVLRREDYSDVHIYIMDIKRNSSRTILEGVENAHNDIYVADVNTSSTIYNNFIDEIWELGIKYHVLSGNSYMMPFIIYKNANDEIVNATTDYSDEKTFGENLKKISSITTQQNAPDDTVYYVDIKNIDVSYKNSYFNAVVDIAIPKGDEISDFQLRCHDENYHYEYVNNKNVSYSNGRFSVSEYWSDRLHNGTYTFEIWFTIGDDFYIYRKDFDVYNIPCLHQFKASYSWDSDCRGCTVKLCCEKCGDIRYSTCSVISKTVKNATCTSKGSKKFEATAYINGKTYSSSKSIETKALGHSYTRATVVKKANTGKTKGTIEIYCDRCNNYKNETINPIKYVYLSSSSYKYDGKIHRPTVKVIDKAGKTVSSSYYTVSYLYKGKKVNSSNKGKYIVLVTFKTRYVGIKTLTYEIK